MSRLLIALVAAALLALAGCGDDEPAATPTTPLEGTALVDALRDGGYVLYFRHAATTRSGQPDDDLTTCETQRNLNPAGRRQAREIGAAFRELGIPVGRVISSPYCRTKDTATLAFGRVDEETMALKDGGQPLADLVAGLPREGPNTILSGHGMDRVAPLHLPVLDEGEAAVLALLPDGTTRRVARVKAGEWAGLEN
jgi:hypothetical protein